MCVCSAKESLNKCNNKFGFKFRKKYTKLEKDAIKNWRAINNKTCTLVQVVGGAATKQRLGAKPKQSSVAEAKWPEKR